MDLFLLCCFFGWRYSVLPICCFNSSQKLSEVAFPWSLRFLTFWMAFVRLFCLFFSTRLKFSIFKKFSPLFLWKWKLFFDNRSSETKLIIYCDLWKWIRFVFWSYSFSSSESSSVIFLWILSDWSLNYLRVTSIWGIFSSSLYFSAEIFFSPCFSSFVQL